MENILKYIYKHAEECYPKEACGFLVIKNRIDAFYMPCKNLAIEDEDFRIDPYEYVQASRQGIIAGVVHTHPDATPEPSSMDIKYCNNNTVPWIIVSYPDKEVHIQWPGHITDTYSKRHFIYGIIDCMTLFRDYYRKELNILVPDVFRDDDFWDKGYSQYLDNYERVGFEYISSNLRDIRLHDVMLFKLFANTANHLGVYVGDGNMLHHQISTLSSVDLVDGIWAERLHGIYRYRG